MTCGLVLVLGLVVLGAGSRYSHHDSVAATMNSGINRMWAGSVAFYEAEHLDAQGKVLPKRFPVSTPLTPAIDCCSLERTSCQVTPGDWTDAGWRELGFVPYDPFRAQYQYMSAGTGKDAQFLALAVGNHSCKGEWVYMARRGRIGKTGDVEPVGPLYTGDRPPPPLTSPPP